MAIEKPGLRLYTPAEAGRFIDRRLQRDGVREKTPLAQLVRPGNIAASLVSVAGVQEVGTPSATLLDLGLLFDPNSDMVAMATEVTVGQMRQFVRETGYEPKGQKTGEFQNQIQNGDATAPMFFTNEADCLAFIKWALPKARVRDSRIQTLGLPSGEQWVGMKQVFKGKQSGENWERLSDNYFCSFLVEGCFGAVSSHDDVAFRLVGTYTN